MICSVRSIATGCRPPTPSWNGLSSRLSSSSIAVMTATTVPISSACTTARSPLSAKNSMYTTISPDVKNSTSHSGVGITPTAPWIRSLRAVLPGRRLAQPPVVGRLLGRGPRLDGPQRAEHLDGPRVELLAERAVLHPLPLHAGHRPGVADQLAGQLARGCGDAKNCAVSTCCATMQRLGLRAGPGRVVAGERQEHHEAEQHREPGRQHAEHAGGTVAVVEVAAVRRPAPHQQHRPDGQRNGDENDHHVEQDV